MNKAVEHPPALRDKLAAVDDLLDPIPGDTALPKPKRSSLDRLYQRVSDSLDRLLRTLGLAFSPPINENKIPVDAPIMG